jgi:type IV pilus assembly protein PilB
MTLRTRRRLEDLLLEEGMLDEAALRQARRHARRSGFALSRALVEMRLLTDGALAEMLVRRLHLPRVDLEHEAIDEEAVREVPHDLADGRRLLPLTIDRAGKRRVIRVAMSDPLDLDSVEEIEMSTGCDLEPLVAPVGDLADAIRKNYRGVITKMIPRQPDFGTTGNEPSTQPNHKIDDEVESGLKLQALVELLVERGQLDRDAWAERVRKLAKEKAEE